MDESQLRDLIPPKEENPLLKRKPLNLGTRFTQFSSPEQPLEVENLLARSHLTLLFFASEWCNISRSFVSPLRAFYEEANLEDKRIQVVYVGFDKSKKDFEAFTKGMPWIGLSFADERTAGLKEFYDVRAVPRLLLVDSRGEAVPNDYRQDIYSLQADQAVEKWEQLKAKQDKNYYYEESA